MTLDLLGAYISDRVMCEQPAIAVHTLGDSEDHLPAHDTSRSLECLLKGHIDDALAISNSVQYETKVSREGDGAQQLLQLAFATCEAHRPL